MSRLGKLGAFGRHGLRLATSYKLAFATRYVSMSVSLVFFYYLDQLFQQQNVQVVQQGSYFAFLLIGSAMSKYLDLGMRSFSQNLRDEMLWGTIEPLLATATPASLALLGPSIWMLAEGTVLLFLQLGLGALAGADFSQANWLSALLVIGASITCILCYAILSAAFTLIFKRSDPVNWLVGSIAYVFSGVFFPVTVFPPALRWVSYLLPFTYAIRGLRGALMEGLPPGEIWLDIAVPLGFGIVLLPCSLWAMRAALRKLKQTGELSHY